MNPSSPGRLTSSRTTSGRAFLDRLAHRGAAVRLRDLVAVRAEVLREHFAHGSVVLDDQDAAVECHGPRIGLMVIAPEV